MEAILCQASMQSVEKYAKFSSTFGTKEDLDFLLQVSAQLAGSKTASNLLGRLTRVIPFLAFVNDAKMDALIEHFRQSLDFTQYDSQHSPEQVMFNNNYLHVFNLFYVLFSIYAFLKLFLGNKIGTILRFDIWNRTQRYW